MTTPSRRVSTSLRVVFAAALALTFAIVLIADVAAATAFSPQQGVLTGNVPAEAAARPPASRPAEFEKWFESLPRQTVPVSGGGDAAVLIVKFSDYQCPICVASYFAMKPVLEKYQKEMPGAVRLISLDYPLDQACNPALQNNVHPGSCVAALAVRMAAGQNRAAEMEEYLYSNAGKLTTRAMQQAAITVGLVPNWNEQVPAALTAVRGDIALADLLSIHGTPTFFVNGLRVEGGMTSEQWDLAIRLELKRAGRLK
jgi:protein-disulfide isomerase